jgi:hypothetical protein
MMRQYIQPGKSNLSSEKVAFATFMEKAPIVK